LPLLRKEHKEFNIEIKKPLNIQRLLNSIYSIFYKAPSS
jgi:hypothetical protein